MKKRTPIIVVDTIEPCRCTSLPSRPAGGRLHAA
jgi:hypothetical protein